MYVSRLAGRVLAVGLALWCGTSPAAAQLLYEQTPSGPTYNYAYWSSNDYGGGSTVFTADSFQSTESKLLSRITWWGVYDGEAPSPYYESFTIRIYADNGGEPGAVLATYNTGDHNASRTATGRFQTWPEFNPDPNTAAEYSYKWTLPTPFAIEANTTYWISIAASVQNGRWYWSHSAHPQSVGAKRAWGDPNGWWDDIFEPFNYEIPESYANTAFRLDSFAPPSYETYQQPRLNGVGGASSTPTATEWADSFTLTGASTIKRIVWWGGYGPLVNWGNPDDFTIRIYADDAGQPGTEIASYAAGEAYRWGYDGDGYLEFPTPGDPWSGFSSFTYEYILPTPLAVQANTRYWISVVNARTDETWRWQASDSAHELGLQFRDATLTGSPWTAHTTPPVHDVAFRIETAPVPPYEQRPWHMGFWGTDPAAFTSADSFVLTETTDVTRISWWGGYLNGNWYPPAGSDNFTVHIFADNGGQPGALIVTYTPGDQVFRTLTGGVVDYGYPSAGIPPMEEYFYSMALPAPLTLQANTRYWINITTPHYSHVTFVWEGAEWNGGPGVYINTTDPVLGPWTNWGTSSLSFRFDR